MSDRKALMKPSKRAMLQYFDDMIVEHMMYYTPEELVIMEYIFSNIENYSDNQDAYFNVKIEKGYLLKHLEQMNLDNLNGEIELIIRKMMFRYTVFRDKLSHFLHAIPLFRCMKFDGDNLVVSLEQIYVVLIMDVKNKHKNDRWRDVLRFNSSVGATFYKFIQSYLETPEFVISLSELKFKLNQVDKYCNYNNFKIKVIKVGIHNINKHTNLYVSFEEIRNQQQELQLKFNIFFQRC